ncbi:sensor domain-containing diguanylate cyclase [Roseospira visakhapatnamensis]|uniref:Diguanylate cyclase (GGDEF)-like protein/PAS domain S-box-containing protein n=1 Tax=Roseospira visakhapatnamensis TaxID=390880 RepID=A0A7W6W9Z3_9PROT|nr:PAS domain-containing protein [Roseospira visakhapatnamensis]MBB4266464.1 diguanylate cyclase (GGDEF)-like protein/PAS domain S-box-containing protein [Roseospira visakhapatnamensis]
MSDRNGARHRDHHEPSGHAGPPVTARDAVSETILGVALNAAGDAMAIKDADLRFRFVNQALCRAVGRPAEAILGKGAWDLFPDDMADQVTRDDRVVLDTGRGMTRDLPLTAVGGGLTWVSIRTDPMMVEGRPAGVITVMRDISAPAGTERRLHGNDDLIDRFFNQGTVAVAYLDRAFAVLRVNDAFARIGGGRPEDFAGRACDARLPGFDLRPLLQQVLDTGQTVTDCAHPLWPGGRSTGDITYWDVSVQPVRDAAGMIDALILTLGEVTDRVRRDEEMRRARSLYQGLFDASSAVMLLIDPDDGRILKANEAAMNYYGYDAATLGTMSIQDINVLSEPAVWDLCQQARRRRRSLFQARHRLADGTIHDVEVNATPLDLDGRAMLFCIIHDVTERTRVEAALRASEREKALILGSVTESVVFYESSDLRIHWCNRASAESVGADTATLIGTSCYHHWSDRDAPCPECPVLESFDTQSPAECTRSTPDGRVWSLQAHPVFDDRGHLRGVVEVGRDVTEQRAAEASVARSLANLHAFFDSSRDFLTVFDEDGSIVAVNRTLETRLGWSEQVLVGQPVFTLHPRPLRADAIRCTRDLVAGATKSSTLPLLTRDGDYVPVETTVVHGTWDDRPAVFSTSRDISDLALSRQMFETTFRDNATLMLITEPDTGRVVDANHAFLATLGLSEAEVIGQTTVALGFVKDAEARGELIKAILDAGEGQPCEVSVIGRDGHLVVGQVSGRMISSGSHRYLLTMITDVTRQRALMDELEHKATHDPLTGAYNRQVADRVLDQEIRRAERLRTPLSLILVDLDHFKAVNDHFGHLTGDRVLCEVVARLSGRIRETDVLARWGGEEFLIVLPGTDAPGARQLAETLRGAVAHEPFRDAGTITLSQGVAAYLSGESVADWIARADAALYAAKATGRNRVCGD